MIDFFRHIPAPVFNDVLEGLHKPFTDRDASRHVPITGLIGDALRAFTPVDIDPSDMAIAAVVALREAGLISCRFELYISSLVIFEEPTCVSIYDAGSVTKVFDDPRVTNNCIHMIEAGRMRTGGRGT